MPGSLEQPQNLPPTYQREIEAIWHEIRKLWMTSGKRGKSDISQAVFSFHGLLGNKALELSAPFYQPIGGELFEAVVALDVPGTTNTIVSMYRNDAVQLPSLILPANASFVSIPLEMFSVTADRWQVRCLSVGTGAKSLCVMLRFGSSQ